MLPDPQSSDRLEDRPDWQPLLESVHRPRNARESFCVPRQVSFFAKRTFLIFLVFLLAHSARSSPGLHSWARLTLGTRINNIQYFAILQVFHIICETFWESRWQATEPVRENSPRANRFHTRAPSSLARKQH